MREIILVWFPPEQMSVECVSTCKVLAKKIIVGECCGLNCVPPKQKHCSSKPQHLNM